MLILRISAYPIETAEDPGPEPLLRVIMSRVRGKITRANHDAASGWTWLWRLIVYAKLGLPQA